MQAWELERDLGRAHAKLRAVTKIVRAMRTTTNSSMRMNKLVNQAWNLLQDSEVNPE